MTGSRVWVGAAAALVLSVGAADVGAQERVFEWEGRMAAGDVLEVRGITGSIRAEPARGRTASVRAEKHGDRDDFDRVEIVVVEERDGYTVCALYASRRSRGGACDGDHDDRDRRGGRSIDVDVEFVVHVPDGVELVGAMVTGDIEADGLDGDVSANTVTGDVTVSTAGTARANTVSGSIDVEMGTTDFDELVFRSVSGDITLALPAGLDARVEFQSLSGDLDSDFRIDVERTRKRFIGQSLRGTIGDGGRTLSFSTVSGDVRLRRTRR